MTNQIRIIRITKHCQRNMWLKIYLAKCPWLGPEESLDGTQVAFVEVDQMDLSHHDVHPLGDVAKSSFSWLEHRNETTTLERKQLEKPEHCPDPSFWDTSHSGIANQYIFTVLFSMWSKSSGCHPKDRAINTQASCLGCMMSQSNFPEMILLAGLGFLRQKTLIHLITHDFLADWYNLRG